MSAFVRRPLLIAAACWAAFAGVLTAAYSVPIVQWADGHAVAGFLSFERPWLETIAGTAAHLADPLPFTVATLVLAAVAIARGRPRHAAAVVFLLGGANVTSQVLKATLAHDRGGHLLGQAHIAAAAFPSGHATASMSLAFAAVLVAPAALRPLVAVAGAIFTLAVSEAILLLAWHFPSDVIGGYLIATSFACLAVGALRAADERWPARSGREAAKRVLDRGAFGRAAAGLALLGAGALLALALKTGDRALAYADQHTTVVAAAIAVAALAATLPLALGALTAHPDRRP
jgi:membrane-associated phospholipid phosphatase